MGPSLTRKRLIMAGALVIVLGVGISIYIAVSTWGQVNRVSIARDADPLVEDDSTADADSGDGSGEEEPPEPAFLDDDLDIFLLVGSDSREELSETTGFGAFEGRRADVVMVVIRDHGEAAILSLPRDLWIESACDGEPNRLNEELEGCGDLLNGPTLLTLTVERLIGEGIDHFAMVDLAGFQDAVDALGGYEICLERPVRDSRAALDLPAGCTMASGAETLAWMRSRHTEELTASGWRVMPGVNDLARNERQRDFLIDLMGRLSDFSSPQSLAGTARALAQHITVDSELSLVSAVDLAWTLRGIDDGHVVELELPVEDHTTTNGAAVLLPARPVDELVDEFLAGELVGEDQSVVG